VVSVIATDTLRVYDDFTLTKKRRSVKKGCERNDAKRNDYLISRPDRRELISQSVTLDISQTGRLEFSCFSVLYMRDARSFLSIFEYFSSVIGTL
jgi:hypothetical protein